MLFAKSGHLDLFCYIPCIKPLKESFIQCTLIRGFNLVRTQTTASLSNKVHFFVRKYTMLDTSFFLHSIANCMTSKTAILARHLSQTDYVTFFFLNIQEPKLQQKLSTCVNSQKGIWKVCSLKYWYDYMHVYMRSTTLECNYYSQAPFPCIMINANISLH